MTLHIPPPKGAEPEAQSRHVVCRRPQSCTVEGWDPAEAGKEGEQSQMEGSGDTVWDSLGCTHPEGLTRKTCLQRCLWGAPFHPFSQRGWSQNSLHFAPIPLH